MVNEVKLTTALADFARSLLLDVPVQRILDEVVVRVVELLPVWGAGITLVGPEVRQPYVAASSPQAMLLEQLHTELDQGPCRAASALRWPVTLPDTSSDRLFPAFSRAAGDKGCAAVFSFPLGRGAAQLGALTLYRETAGELDAHDLHTAQTLADVVASYLLNAQWRERMRRDLARFRRRALHDPLTGLANRVLLEERLEHAAQRIPRAHTAYAVLFLDLDDFKRVNDGHGHQVGDELLVAVAERLRALVRPGDTLARISGDEFVLLCEDLKGSMEIDAIRRRVRDAFSAPFDVGGRQITVAASVGVAHTDLGGQPSSQLLVEADLAMYRDKDLSRRRRVIGLVPAESPP